MFKICLKSVFTIICHRVREQFQIFCHAADLILVHVVGEIAFLKRHKVKPLVLSAESVSHILNDLSLLFREFLPVSPVAGQIILAEHGIFTRNIHLL